VILGIGLDVVETARIAQCLAQQGRQFEERVFTVTERDACEGRVDRVEALAARFAAKEACAKALGTGWSEGVSYLQVEVTRGNGGAPAIRLSGAAADLARERGVRRVHVTISHQQRIAAAAVILEG
jgi:holo-[acyl-carrier protein] synthase